MFSIIWNSIIDNIPWWGYVLALGIALALTYQIWFPIWGMLPTPVKALLVAIGGGFTAYIAGRNRGAQNARAADKEKVNQALTKRVEVNQRVEKMTPSEVDAELDKKGDFRD